MENKHFLIVGAGISGLSIAYFLLEKGQKITLIDSGTNKSSRVAAGMINPLVFRRMAKSWDIDVLLPFAKRFYTKIEEQTKQTFYHPIVIRRFFSSEQEHQFWVDRQYLKEYIDYMSPLEDSDSNYTTETIKNEYGSGRVRNSAWIDTPLFLDACKRLIQEDAIIINDEFDYSALDCDKKIYNGERFDGFIFCEGFEVYKNPWFSFIPIQPTKGEILTIHSEQIPNDESLNRKCFVLPIGNNKFKVGSTYVWSETDSHPTEAGKKELVSNFNYLSSEKPEIIEHTAGIRPTTPDRRPIIGEHPTHSGLYVFNGLGAKGYLIGPMHASKFVEYLVHETPLDHEVNLKRFKKIK